LTPLWPIEHACLGAARTGRLVLPVWARRASGCLSHVLCVAVDGQWCRMVLGGIARAGPSWLAGLLGLGGEGRGAGDDLQEIADPAVPGDVRGVEGFEVSAAERLVVGLGAVRQLGEDCAQDAVDRVALLRGGVHVSSSGSGT